MSEHSEANVNSSFTIGDHNNNIIVISDNTIGNINICIPDSCPIDHKRCLEDTQRDLDMLTDAKAAVTSSDLAVETGMTVKRFGLQPACKMWDFGKLTDATEAIALRKAKPDGSTEQRGPILDEIPRLEEGRKPPLGFPLPDLERKPTLGFPLPYLERGPVPPTQPAPAPAGASAPPPRPQEVADNNAGQAIRAAREAYEAARDFCSQSEITSEGGMVGREVVGMALGTVEKAVVLSQKAATAWEKADMVNEGQRAQAIAQWNMAEEDWRRKAVELQNCLARKREVFELAAEEKPMNALRSGAIKIAAPDLELGATFLIDKVRKKPS